MATGIYSQLGTAPSYNAQVSPVAAPVNDQAYWWGGGVTETANQIGAAAEAERQASLARNAERANVIQGGYDQQLANSRIMANQGYQNINDNYAGLTADAAATRDRNMARIDQYGNSARSDLAIKNQQMLAAASQSAIKRGLGNTTIQDSLVRGQNFDNTRQSLALEDQLLQNRISTDASLSGAYQNTLQNRAQSLASQWNKNMDTENGITGQRLQFLADIQDQGPSFNDVSNYYLQGAAAKRVYVEPPAPQGLKEMDGTPYMDAYRRTHPFGI
jgi:hypothetical protein